jgi:raffinose/stachyose/melibiose transport system permease protein
MIGGNRFSLIARYIIISLLLIFFMTPFFLMVLNSIKTTQEFVTSPFSLPETIDFDNYIYAFSKMNFLTSFLNSVIITFLSVSFVVISASMMAYLLSRYKWKINKIIFAIFVASMIVPFQAIMIPLVSIYGNTFHFMNNKWILVFMYLGFGQAFAIFIFHGFIKNIPLEMEEAAFIDGCNPMQSFIRIVFPLLTPVVMTVVVLDVLWIWNDYLLPSLVLISPQERTLPLSTYNFFSSFSVDYAPLMAGLVLTIVPVLLIYIFAQKQIIKGVVYGAIK